MIDREAIAAALFDVARDSGGYVTVGRRLRHWSDVTPTEMPALFMSEKGGHAAYQAQAVPTTWTLRYDFFIYAHSSHPYRAPAIVLNELLDSLERALLPSPTTGLQRLGLDTVRHARIEGEVQTDEGVLGDLAIAIVPVEILAV